jgi:hypothetical protein
LRRFTALRMFSFQLVGLDHTQFEPLFDLTDGVALPT